MYYLKEEDYLYVKNKHHDTSKPYDAFNRFISHEEIFDDATGISPEKVTAGVLENDKQYQDMPHSIRKARALEYVLENTKIACDKRDRFPAICSIDRPINNTLVGQWKKEVLTEKMPETEKRRQFCEWKGIVTIWPDYDHSVPNWERIYKFGFKGLGDAAAKAKKELAEKKELSIQEEAFFDSIIIEYAAICRFVLRLSDLAEKENTRLKDSLLFIAENPPKTFYHCLLVNHLFFMIIEHIEGMQARSLSNFDRVLYPYYKNDLDNGITREDLKTDLAYYLMQFAAIDNYWGQPVYFGGTKEDGTSQINELSYDFFEVYDKLGIYNPKLQIKLAKNTPRDFVMQALTMIRGGNNSIVFVSDELVTKSLIGHGATPEQARLCNITGCYEFSVQDTAPVAMIYLNLMKPFEYTMSGGYDGVTGEEAGLKTSTDFASFDEFYETYLKQLTYCMNMVYDIVDDIGDYNGYINPQPMLSATYATALERGKDMFEGGSVSTATGIQFGYIANISDSLTTVKELVFEKKEYSIAELKEILDNNFEGHEALRMRMLSRMPHYGNNEEIPDGFAKNITDYIVETTKKRINKFGFKWGCGFHVARMSYIQGEKTAASPDGRLFGEELSKNVSPSMGRNKAGATAAILSATKLNCETFTSDACLDLGLHPTSVQGDDGLEVMYGLLQTFHSRGGHALHINVFDAEVLKDAQKNPENYSDLQIRVCGWNVLFNNINKKEQDQFIRQAEALV